MAITTVTGRIDHRYLMSKNKSELAWMYLELLKDYNKELERNTPRPTFGIRIVLDQELPGNKCVVQDTLGRKIGEVDYE